MSVISEDRLDTIRRLVEERGLTPCNAFFASFLAGFEQAGVLTQGVVNLVATHAAEVIRDYLYAMNLMKTRGEGVQKAASIVESLLEALAWGTFKVETSERGLVVRIVSSRCRYCPKGIGRAQIPGTACPLPKLLERLMQLEGLEARLVMQRNSSGKPTALIRREGQCVIVYEIGG